MNADDRELIERRINEIAVENGGKLTAELLVIEAADPDSVLHKSFEWDNDKAAHQHRLDQARTLIRSVRIVTYTETTVVRSIAYVRDPNAGDEQGYVALASLKSDREKAIEAVRYETKRASAAMHRAKEVGDVLGLGELVDSALAMIAAVSESAE